MSEVHSSHVSNSDVMCVCVSCRDGVPVRGLGWHSGSGRLLGLQRPGEPVGLHLQGHRKRGEGQPDDTNPPAGGSSVNLSAVHQSERPERPLLPQDVHRLATPADLHAGPLPGLQRQEQQVLEERLLPLRHHGQHLDAPQRRHVSGRRAQAGV